VPRPVSLTILMVALPLLLLVPGVQRAAGPAWYRVLAIWGLPAAAGLIVAPLVRRLPGTDRVAASAPRLLRLAPWCALAFLADYSFLPVGRSAGWLTLTYGDQALYGSVGSTALWALPLCMALGILGWERALRRGLLCAWITRIPIGAAVAFSSAVGVLFAAPAVLNGFALTDLPFTAAAFVSAACREVSCSLIFISGGGLVLAGLYRGWLFYVEGFVLNDWSSLSFPAANYASSDPLFYLFRGLSAVLAMGIVTAGAWSVSRRGGPGRS
jgi:hypothetical protein